MIGLNSSSQSKRYRSWSSSYSELLHANGIEVSRDGKRWYVYRNGTLMAEAPRRFLVTKTNPKPRELMPRFGNF